LGHSMPIIVYGIRNCDTIKKARGWLDREGIAYDFHDYKTMGIDAERLKAWCKEFGWETILNRSGTTFRKLPETKRENLDLDKAIELMLAQPSMIKRPIIDTGGRRIVGFSSQVYAEAFGGGR